MTEIGSPEIESHGISRPGKVREDNQDAIRFWRPDDLSVKYGPLYGIADGMGGDAHGGVASSLALETFFDTFYKTNGISVPQKLRLGVQNANLGIYQTAQRLGVARMGTTLTAVNLVGKTLNLVHVGDSRAYLIRDNLATCLTNDHTRVGEMVRMKMLSAEKVRTHAQRSVLEKIARRHPGHGTIHCGGPHEGAALLVRASRPHGAACDALTAADHAARFPPFSPRNAEAGAGAGG